MSIKDFNTVRRFRISDIIDNEHNMKMVLQYANGWCDEDTAAGLKRLISRLKKAA